ncbi:hypothetical protein BDF19DRAFT_425071 [Syncephalis fuscata]|nr:hypothetical protein BDF19DRAFT_425071 [Syncephalis fuscata]
MSDTESMEISTGDTAVIADSEPITFQFDILSFVHEARNTYGLRHEDYQRYRQYCARKLQRLRKALSFVQTKGRKFHKRVVEENVLTDVRFLELALVDCERAWATAMELKVYARDEPRKQYHMIRRLRKATGLAQQFVALCNVDSGRVDVRTALDAKAYAAWIEGILHVEQRAWQSGLNQLTVASVIYERMAQTGTAYQENLCQAMMDQIEPNIRLCIYHLRLKEGERETKTRETAAISRLPELKQLQTSESRVSSADVITDTFEWRNYTMPLINEQLRTALSQIHEAEANFNIKDININDADVTKTAMSTYKAVLEAYTRLERIARRLVKEDEASSAKIRSSKSEQRSLALRRIHDFAVYRRLQHTIHRQAILASAVEHRVKTQQAEPSLGSRMKRAKWSDAVKLQGDIIQANDVALTQEVEASIKFYRAELCRYVVEGHAHEQRFSEAFALLDRVQEYLRQAKSDKVETIDKDALFSAESLKATEQAVCATQLRLQATWTIYSNQKSPTLSDQMAALSLQNADNDKAPSTSIKTGVSTHETSLSFPPNMQPVSVKPVFFDLALNYIDYDADTIATRGGKKGQGITGLLGGLWGRK